LIWATGALGGDVRFFNMELRTLLRQATDSTSSAAGAWTGPFNFAGTQITSVDVSDRISDCGAGADSRHFIPVLQQLAPFLGNPTRFYLDSGEISARWRAAGSNSETRPPGTVLQVKMAATSRWRTAGLGGDQDDRPDSRD